MALIQGQQLGSQVQQVENSVGQMLVRIHRRPTRSKICDLCVYLFANAKQKQLSLT